MRHQRNASEFSYLLLPGEEQGSSYHLSMLAEIDGLAMIAVQGWGGA